MKNVAAWGMHLLAGGRNSACRQNEIALMRAVERELRDDGVVGKIEAVEFSVRVGKRGRVDVDRDPNILAVIFFPAPTS